MGRVCMVRDLVAELVMGRVCYGPRCPGIKMKVCSGNYYRLLVCSGVLVCSGISTNPP